MSNEKIRHCARFARGGKAGVRTLSEMIGDFPGDAADPDQGAGDEADGNQLAGMEEAFRFRPLGYRQGGGAEE